MSNTIVNRFALISSKTSQRVVPLVATTPDDIGSGVLVTATARAKLGASAEVIFAALTQAGCYPIAKGHGLRWMLPDGSASPCFTERVGLSTGAVYVWQGRNKQAAFFAALADAGLPHTIGVDCAYQHEGGQKSGAKYSANQPLTAEQAATLVSILCRPDFTSTGGGEHSAVGGNIGQVVDAEDAPQSIPALEGTEDDAAAAKPARKAKRKVSSVEA